MEKQPLLEKKEVTSIRNISYGTFFLQIEQVKQAEYAALKKKHFAIITQKQFNDAYFGEEPQETGAIVELFENAFKALVQINIVAIEDVKNQLMEHAKTSYGNRELQVRIADALDAQVRKLVMTAASQAAP